MYQLSVSFRFFLLLLFTLNLTFKSTQGSEICCPKGSACNIHYHGLAISRNATRIDCTNCQDTIFVPANRQVDFYCHPCGSSHKSGFGFQNNTPTPIGRLSGKNDIIWKLEAANGELWISRGRHFTISRVQKGRHEGWLYCSQNTDDDSGHHRRRRVASQKMVVCDPTAVKLARELSYFDCLLTIDLDSHQTFNCSWSAGVLRHSSKNTNTKSPTLDSSSNSKCTNAVTYGTASYTHGLISDRVTMQNPGQACRQLCETERFTNPKNFKNPKEMHMGHFDTTFTLRINGTSPLGEVIRIEKALDQLNYYRPTVRPKIFPGPASAGPGCIQLHISVPRILREISHMVSLSVQQRKNLKDAANISSRRQMLLEKKKDFIFSAKPTTNKHDGNVEIRKSLCDPNILGYYQELECQIKYRLARQGNFSPTFVIKSVYSSAGPPTRFPLRGITFLPAKNSFLYSPYDQDFHAGGQNVELKICINAEGYAKACHSAPVEGSLNLMSVFHNVSPLKQKTISFILTNSEGYSSEQKVNLSTFSIHQGRNQTSAKFTGEPKISLLGSNFGKTHFIQICWNVNKSTPIGIDQTLLFCLKTGTQSKDICKHPQFMPITCKDRFNSRFDHSKIIGSKHHGIANIKWQPRLRSNGEKLCIASRNIMESTDDKILHNSNHPFAQAIFAAISHCISGSCVAEQAAELKNCRPKTDTNPSSNRTFLALSQRLEAGTLCIAAPQLTCGLTFTSYNLQVVGSRHKRRIYPLQFQPSKYPTICGPDEAAIKCSAFGGQKNFPIRLVGQLTDQSKKLHEKYLTSEPQGNLCELSGSKVESVGEILYILIVPLVILALLGSAGACWLTTRRQGARNYVKAWLHRARVCLNCGLEPEEQEYEYVPPGDRRPPLPPRNPPPNPPGGGLNPEESDSDESGEYAPPGAGAGGFQPGVTPAGGSRGGRAQNPGPSGSSPFAQVSVPPQDGCPDPEAPERSIPQSPFLWSEATGPDPRTLHHLSIHNQPPSIPGSSASAIGCNSNLDFALPTPAMSERSISPQPQNFLSGEEDPPMPHIHEDLVNHLQGLQKGSILRGSNPLAAFMTSPEVIAGERGFDEIFLGGGGPGQILLKPLGPSGLLESEVEIPDPGLVKETKPTSGYVSRTDAPGFQEEDGTFWVNPSAAD